jgi:tetrahydromethanopterin S-methyltransferase subunit B
MPKFKVEVIFQQKKELEIYANDEEAAEDKATEIVQGWPNVIDVDQTTVLEQVE